MPNFRQRKWILVAIAIAAIVVITLVIAPSSGNRKNNSGSTYSRRPDGYGAWYEYMSERDVAIDRWRQPLTQLIEDDVQNVTYVQIRSKQDFLSGALNISDRTTKWVDKGNTLVIIGKYEPATGAEFSSSIPYRQQTLSNTTIQIDTTRRYRGKNKDSTNNLLKDRYGAVVWQKKVGRGKIIYCTTPYLAANAYQDYPDNYQFLADLVDDRQAIWIDEYIHGYKDRDAIVEEQEGTLLGYLARTPWFFLFIQGALMMVVAAIAAFRRFGSPAQPQTAIADNSTAYIDALAGVLEKANSTDFVVATISKDEQRKLQQSLGIGKSLVDDETLIAACKHQKGEVATEVGQLLQTKNKAMKISDARLIIWIEKWQKINQNT